MLLNEGIGKFNKETTVNTVTYWVQNTIGVEQKSFPIISEWHLGLTKAFLCYIEHLHQSCLGSGGILVGQALLTCFAHPEDKELDSIIPDAAT